MPTLGWRFSRRIEGRTRPNTWTGPTHPTAPVPAPGSLTVTGSLSASFPHRWKTGNRIRLFKSVKCDGGGTDVYVCDLTGPLGHNTIPHTVRYTWKNVPEKKRFWPEIIRINKYWHTGPLHQLGNMHLCEICRLIGYKYYSADTIYIGSKINWYNAYRQTWFIHFKWFMRENVS